MIWKKKALEPLALRVELIRQIPGPLPDYCRLPEGYVLDIAASRSVCECGTTLRVQWLETQSPRGVLLGEPDLHHHIKQCPGCRRVYRCEHLDELVPSHGNYAFDLIVEVGLARFLKHQQNREIQRLLQNRFGLRVPCTTISHLANTFLDCYAAVHYAHAETVKALVSADGGYALHVDGTCDAGTETLFVALDGRSGLVLTSAKMNTENVKDITELLRRCVKLFGLPVSIMRDLSKNIGDAVDAVLSSVRGFICHYHFLQAVGTRLCERHHRRLTKQIRKLRIKAALKSMRSELVKCSKTGARISREQILEFLEDPRQMLHLDAVQLRRYLSYLLLRWLDDYGADMKGRYFPFDLPSLIFVRRCMKLHALLENLLVRHELKPHQFRTLQTIRDKLAVLGKDAEVLEATARLERAENLFNKLRTALRFNISDKKPLLRQHAPHSSLESALNTEARLTTLRTELEHIADDAPHADTCTAAQVVLDYLQKYWKKLFGHAVVIEGRTQPILVSRTNNVPEHFFAHNKQQLRRKLGVKTLNRCIQAMRPEEMLVANLKHPSYVDAIYDGSLENLAAAFAKHCQGGKNIRRQRRQCDSTHPMPLSKKKLRDEDLIAKIETGMDALIGFALQSRPAA